MQEEGKAMSGVGKGRVAVCKNRNKEFQSDDRVVKSQSRLNEPVTWLNNAARDQAALVGRRTEPKREPAPSTSASSSLPSASASSSS